VLEAGLSRVFSDNSSSSTGIGAGRRTSDGLAAYGTLLQPSGSRTSRPQSQAGDAPVSRLHLDSLSQGGDAVAVSMGSHSGSGAAQPGSASSRGGLLGALHASMTGTVRRAMRLSSDAPLLPVTQSQAAVRAVNNMSGSSSPVALSGTPRSSVSTPGVMSRPPTSSPGCVTPGQEAAEDGELVTVASFNPAPATVSALTRASAFAQQATDAPARSASEEGGASVAVASAQWAGFQRGASLSLPQVTIPDLVSDPLPPHVVDHMLSSPVGPMPSDGQQILGAAHSAQPIGQNALMSTAAQVPVLPQQPATDHHTSPAPPHQAILAAQNSVTRQASDVAAELLRKHLQPSGINPAGEDIAAMTVFATSGHLSGSSSPAPQGAAPSPGARTYLQSPHLSHDTGVSPDSPSCSLPFPPTHILQQQTPDRLQPQQATQQPAPPVTGSSLGGPSSRQIPGQIDDALAALDGDHIMLDVLPSPGPSPAAKGPTKPTGPLQKGTQKGGPPSGSLVLDVLPSPGPSPMLWPKNKAAAPEATTLAGTPPDAGAQGAAPCEEEPAAGSAGAPMTSAGDQHQEHAEAPLRPPAVTPLTIPVPESAHLEAASLSSAGSSLTLASATPSGASLVQAPHPGVVPQVHAGTAALASSPSSGTSLATVSEHHKHGSARHSIDNEGQQMQEQRQPRPFATLSPPQHKQRRPSKLGAKAGQPGSPRAGSSPPASPGRSSRANHVAPTAPRAASKSLMSPAGSPGGRAGAKPNAPGNQPQVVEMPRLKPVSSDAAVAGPLYRSNTEEGSGGGEDWWMLAPSPGTSAATPYSLGHAQSLGGGSSGLPKLPVSRDASGTLLHGQLSAGSGGRASGSCNAAGQGPSGEDGDDYETLWEEAMADGHGDEDSSDWLEGASGEQGSGGGAGSSSSLRASGSLSRVGRLKESHEKRARMLALAEAKAEKSALRAAELASRPAPNDLPSYDFPALRATVLAKFQVSHGWGGGWGGAHSLPLSALLYSTLAWQPGNNLSPSWPTFWADLGPGHGPPSWRTLDLPTYQSLWGRQAAYNNALTCRLSCVQPTSSFGLRSVCPPRLGTSPRARPVRSR
jgi:hypothetical protein